MSFYIDETITWMEKVHFGVNTLKIFTLSVSFNILKIENCLKFNYVRKRWLGDRRGYG